jgi:hypothetical protein
VTSYNKDDLAADVLICRESAAAWFNNVTLQAMERIIRCAESGLDGKIIWKDTRTYYEIVGDVPAPGGYHRDR